MTGVRVVVPADDRQMGSLTRHIRGLQDEGRHVVFVTANRPYEALATVLEADGVDISKVVFIDAVTRVDGSRPTDAPLNVFFLQSPTMLEMIAMRAEQALARNGEGGHLVLDSLNALQLYNGLPMVQEFAHYLINRLRTRGAAADLIVLPTPDGQILEQAVAGFTDGREVLA